MDYFPDDFLCVIDESHVTIPQIGGMYGGDRSRKLVLVENGFRLPSALDNRPLKFEEFEAHLNQVIYVSATPANFELEKAQGVVVEQLIRPTGLLDPIVEVRPCVNQVDDLLDEIDRTVKQNFRVLVTTLTKRMAEELSKYLGNLAINSRYIHSDVDALERVEILRDLSLGKFDVLIGVNLLREGLDLPEVALVAILDADKEGFLRSGRSLIQTAGRAARNSEGRVILYADRITAAMQQLMDETDRRRAKQMKYNEEHGIIPQTIIKSREQVLTRTNMNPYDTEKTYLEPEETFTLAADPVIQYMSKEQLQKTVTETRRKMEKSAKELDFIQAAKYRDELYALEKELSNK